MPGRYHVRKIPRDAILLLFQLRYRITDVHHVCDGRNIEFLNQSPDVRQFPSCTPHQTYLHSPFSARVIPDAGKIVSEQVRDLVFDSRRLILDLDPFSGDIGLHLIFLGVVFDRHFLDERVLTIGFFRLVIRKGQRRCFQQRCIGRAERIRIRSGDEAAYRHRSEQDS